MSRHERQRSRSISLEVETRRRRKDHDVSQYEKDDGTSEEKIRRRHHDRSHTGTRSRSRSPRRERRSNRRRRHSMSPASDRDEDADSSSRRRERQKYRDRSPRESRHRHKRRRSYSNSPSPSRTRSRSPSKPANTTSSTLQRSRGPLPSQNQAFNRDKQALNPNTNPDSDSLTPGPVVEKQKRNFNVTGKLAAASNTVQTAGQTIVLKYHEPAESRKPPARDAWRMYVFKDDEIVDTVQLWEQSCWLFGREIAVADIPTEHPSCSGQHAVVQFRYTEKRNEFGDKIGRVKPYVIDLESAQGTWLNDERIEEGRYLEVRDGDMLKFGRSRREYVVQLPKNK